MGNIKLGRRDHLLSRLFELKLILKIVFVDLGRRGDSKISWKVSSCLKLQPLKFSCKLVKVEQNYGQKTESENRRGGTIFGPASPI